MGSEEEGSCNDENHVVTEVSLDNSINYATVFRYPFQAIELGWLVEYIETCLPKSERWPAAMRILNGFMAFAVMHEDPFLEDATSQFYATMYDKSMKRIWPKRTRDVSINSELAHHIFKAICLIAKYPNSDPTRKVGILNMGEKLLKDIDKPIENSSINISIKKATDALNNTLSRIHLLRQTPDSPEAFDYLMGSLKSLFFCFSPCAGVYNIKQDNINNNIINSYVCCEGCPCYAKLRTTYTLFIRDVEKTKVIDCLIMIAVKEDDAYISKLAEELFTRFDCRSPFLEKPVRRIQNGNLFLVRIALFDAFLHIKSLIKDQRASPINLTPLLDNIILALYITRKDIKDIKGLNEHINLVENAIKIADSIYSKLGTENSSQGLCTLKNFIIDIFYIVSTPEFHLAVHSKDPLIGKGANLKCGNPNCPGKVKEMLKCSGCRVTFYCCVTCQREDWKTHRFLCREMGNRKVIPTSIKIAEYPIQTLKAAALN